MAFDKRRLGREIASARKDALKVRLGELRALIKAARASRHEAIKGVQLDCRAQREQLRSACALRRVEASELGLRGIARAQHVFSHERSTAKAEDLLGKPTRKAKQTAKERSSESDCAVRSNLTPDLVPVFDQVRKHIKGSPRKSRTEEFYQWAEENPHEVYDLQQRQADKDLARLIAEHEQAEKQLRHRSAVPF
jgi:hypothetical protein